MQSQLEGDCRQSYTLIEKRTLCNFEVLLFEICDLIDYRFRHVKTDRPRIMRREKNNVYYNSRYKHKRKHLQIDIII